MKQKSDAWEQNQICVPIQDFIGEYNKSIPETFPRASIKSLKQFQVTHPMLFKNKDEWSIDRHRKRLMDWLFLYREPAQ